MVIRPTGQDCFTRFYRHSGHIRSYQLDEFFSTSQFKRHVLISNGPVLSGQSSNIDLNPVIESLANANKQVAFILTDNKSRLNLSNVFYTSDIIKTDGNDLNSGFITQGTGTGSYTANFGSLEDFNIQLGRTIAGVSDTITIAAQSTTAGADIGAILKWFDLTN